MLAVYLYVWKGFAHIKARVIEPNKYSIGKSSV